MLNARSMKVLRVTTSLDFGGIEKRLVNTAEYRDPEVEFVFVALGSGGWAAEQIALAQRRVIVFGANARIPNLELIRGLVRLIKHEKPHAVHTSGAEANFHGILAARLCGVPVIIGEEIGFPQHGFAAKLVFKLVYQLTTRVIAISEAVKERLCALNEVAPGKVVVVYNPVILPSLAPRVSEGQASCLQLLMVCRLEPVKNIHLVLEVLAHIAPRVPPFKLSIVGKGTELASLKKLCAELRLTSQVSFEGFQSEPARFYQHADIFLLPSLSEGLSNSLLEAMTHGLLCIVTRVGGPGELIRHGETGYTVDPHSRESIELTLASCMNMPRSARQLIGSKARSFAEENFSVSRYVEQLKQVYGHAEAPG